jgi:hypothetical protein
MMLCVAAAAGLLALDADRFTLGWTHSVERIGWQEEWEVSTAGLRPVRARVSGSGAGMEVPDGAVLEDGAWTFRPDVPVQRQVLLAASGRTGEGWRLCTSSGCVTLGAVAERPIRLWVSPVCRES